MLGLIIDQVDIIKAYLKNLLTNNNLPIFMKLFLKIELSRFIKTKLVARLLQSINDLR